jgi:branched-chain amino acid transport system ATP-binding protein
VLQVEDIHTYYGSSYILQGISLEVREGQVLGIIGRNGMGKTTLINSVIGFTPPRRGRVIFQGTELTYKRLFEIPRLGISIVPQGRQIFPSLDVTENLTVVVRGKSSGWTIDQIFKLFPPLKERARHPAGQLSGGEQQMLAIGRSLMTNPILLLMDEPTEGLSPVMVSEVGRVIGKLRENGISILLVEQNLNFALRHADYIHVLERGLIAHSSLPKDLEQNHEARTRFLGV